MYICCVCVCVRVVRRFGEGVWKVACKLLHTRPTTNPHNLSNQNTNRTRAPPALIGMALAIVWYHYYRPVATPAAGNVGLGVDVFV